MVEYDIYRKEIVDFLQTVTIKFELFAEMMKIRLYNELGIEISSEKENPYYLNLCGQYSPLDEKMYVTTIETNEEVLFDTNLKINYPKTALLYRVPSQEYETLCQKYPAQVGLIKSIVYPASDIDTAIAAENFSVLAHDSSLLHSNERESLLIALYRTLRYIYNRWYIADYAYERMYPLTFMGVVWASLPQALLSQRVMNLRTPQVHPMHIWEYLSARGLKEYRDILNDKQALFLYRNIEYLLQNKGKKETLQILAENLLKDLQVSLVGKNILQQTTTRADECITVPEFLSEEVVKYNSFETINESTFESMEQIVHRIADEGYFPDASAEVIAEMELRFGETELNVLPTRLLELEKAILNTQYQGLLLKFLFDTMIYQWNKGKLLYRIQFTDPNTNTPLDLTIGETLALFQYVHHKETGQELTTLPIKCPVRTLYRDTRPTDVELVDTVTFGDTTYPLTTLVDVDTVVREIPYMSEYFETKAEFTTALYEQFEVLIKHIERLRTNASLLYHRGMDTLYQKLTINTMLEFTLVEGSNYQEWLTSSPKIAQLISSYENLPNKQLFYVELCDLLIAQMIPIEDAIFSKYTAYAKDKTALYAGLKKLFIQLCSYRLTFLETDRTVLTFITTPHLCVGGVGGSHYDNVRIGDFEIPYSTALKTVDVTDLSIFDAVSILDAPGSSTDDIPVKSGFEVRTEKSEEAGPIVMYNLVTMKDHSIFDESVVTPLPIGATTYAFTEPFQAEE